MLYHVRQRILGYEDFDVEAYTPEDAIQKVKDGEIVGDGLEYLETLNTYMLDDDGIFASKEQPWNANPPSQVGE